MSSFDYIEPRTAPAADNPPAFQGQALDGPTCARAGRSLRRKGQCHAAAKYYEQAVGFADHNYDLRTAWIDTLVRAGRIEEAEAHSRAALDAYKKVRILYASRALALIHANALEAARPLLDVALEDKTAAWYGCTVEAEMQIRARPDKPQAAVYAFHRAMEAAPDPWEVCFIAGWTLCRAKRPVLAAAFYAESLRIDPGAAAGLVGLGECFQALRLYDQAKFYYECALELAQDLPAAKAGLESCKPGVFGLMRAFGRRGLQEQWRKEYEELKRKTGWSDNAL